MSNATIHDPSTFRSNYISDAERSLEKRLLRDQRYQLFFQLIRVGDVPNAGSLLNDLKQDYNSTGINLEEFNWLDDLVILMETAKNQDILALMCETKEGGNHIKLDKRGGKERANKRPVVNNEYYDFIEREYQSPFAWTELGKTILAASNLTVTSRQKGEERDLTNYRKAQESLFFFDQALFVDDTYVDAYIGKANAYFTMDRTAEAAESLLKATQNLTPLDQEAITYANSSQSREELDELVAKSFKLEPTRKLEFVKRLIIGTKLDHDLTYLTHAARILSSINESTLDTEDKAACLYYRGIVAREQGDLDDAVQYFETAAAIKPAIYDNTLSRPIISMDLIDSLSTIQSHLPEEKNLSSQWTMKGKLTTRQKIQYVSDLLASAQLQQRPDRIKQALYVLHLAKKDSPSLDERSEVEYYTGLAQQLSNNTDQAIASFRESVRLNPDNLLAANKVANLEIDQICAKAKTESYDVTYFMSAYNTSKVEARKAIDSVLRDQKYNWSYQMIYVDDGSTEGATADYIRSIYKEEVKSGKLKVIRTPNQEKAAARNIGLKIFLAGNSKYFTFFDSDDIALPDRTQKLSDYLDNEVEKEMVHARTGFIWETGIDKNSDVDPSTINDQDANDSSVTRYWKSKWEHPERQALPMFRSYRSSVQVMTTMLTRRAVEKARYHNVVWARAQDMMYWASVCRGGSDIGFLDDIVAHQRLRRQ